MTYTVYKNGPYFKILRFYIELLKFWKWKKFKKSWIIWSFKAQWRYYFGKFKCDYDEFLYFWNKYKNKHSWFQLHKVKIVKIKENE